MDILERYLQAVRHWLPSAQQDDIVAELSEDLRSEIEDSEAERGHELDEAELEALLRRRGHPMWVAEGYLPQQHLIGPALLPVYRKVLRISLACLVAIFAALYATIRFAVIASAPPALRQSEFWLWQLAVYGFAYGGLLTLIFAAIERSQVRARSSDAWDPRHPQALPRAPVDAATEEGRRLRVASVADLIASMVFTLWWLGGPRLPPTAGLELTFAPIWQVLYWPIAVLGVTDVALAAVTAMRARQTRAHSALRLARDVYGAMLAALLLGAEQRVAVLVPGAPAARIAQFAAWADLTVTITVGIVGLYYLVQAVRDARAALLKPTRLRSAGTLVAGD